MDEVGQVATTLIEMLNRKKCIAWVGSGLSVPAGYPRWEEVVDSLCKACKVRRDRSEASTESDRLMRLAERCRTKNRALYEQTLADEFGKTVVSDRRAYSQLARLPFQAYITTNYDPLLRDAVLAQNHGFCQYPVLHVPTIERQRSSAFYVHGLARDTDDRPCGRNLILAESEFRQAYGTGGAAANFIRTVLTSYDLCFVGCRLEEPAIEDCLVLIADVHAQFLRECPEAPLPRRAVLLAHRIRVEQQGGISREVLDEAAERNENARYGAFNIDVVRYETTEGDMHVGIEKILSRALQMSGVVAPTTPILTV